MFPDKILLGLSLYEILIVIGIIFGIIIFLKLLQLQNVPKNIQKIYLGFALISLASGFIFAVLVQSILDLLKTGVFSLTGATFLGGLLGGVLTFFFIYKFIIPIKEKKYLNQILMAFIPTLLFGHFMGRIGCFMAGCCYGKETTSGLGILFPHLNHPVHPTQLYEAGFLLVLFGGSLLVFKYKKNNVVYYLLGYGIGRFILEFFRGDDRGKFILGLSPSQVFSIVLIVSGILLLIKTYTCENIYKE